MIRSLRIVAFTEGISYLLLLVVTMPLKYLWDMPQPNYVVGIAHGFLFILYLILAFLVHRRVNWSQKELVLVMLASVIPFATFWVDARIFSKLKN